MLKIPSGFFSTNISHLCIYIFKNILYKGMRRNNPDIIGLARPLKKVLYGKLEKYILIESMINIRKLFTNNFGKFVLIHSDTKMHSEVVPKIHFLRRTGEFNFQNSSISQLEIYAAWKRNSKRGRQTQTRIGGNNKQKKRRSPERRAAFTTSTYISCLRNFQQDISSYQFGG